MKLKKLIKKLKVDVNTKIADPTYGSILEVKYRGKATKISLSNSTITTTRS